MMNHPILGSYTTLKIQTLHLFKSHKFDGQTDQFLLINNSFCWENDIYC